MIVIAFAVVVLIAAGGLLWRANERRKQAVWRAERKVEVRRL